MDVSVKNEKLSSYLWCISRMWIVGFLCFVLFFPIITLSESSGVEHCQK